MPVIDTLPALEVIKGFQGVLDFYCWKGLNCVRTWPHLPRSHMSEKSLAAAALFGAIVKSYSLLGGALHTFFAENADDQPRTGRDLFVSAVLGHLHETHMTDFLTLLTECRDLLTTLTDLTDALLSNDADQLVVRGQDQLVSFKEPLANIKSAVISGANGYLDSNTPPAGTIWHIYNIGIVDSTSATTKHALRVQIGATSHALYDDTTGWAANVRAYHQRELWLFPDQVLRVWFTGGLVGDSCRIDLLGHVMTLET